MQSIVVGAGLDASGRRHPAVIRLPVSDRYHYLTVCHPRVVLLACVCVQTGEGSRLLVFVFLGTTVLTGSTAFTFSVAARVGCRQ